MPANALYVEGSCLDRWLAAEIELQPVRSNRILVIAEEHPTDESLTDMVEATANAARATGGARIAKIIRLEDAPIVTGLYTGRGVATATLHNLTPLHDILFKERTNYDAVAIATIINLPIEYHKRYFAGELKVNPWGGAEAVLTRWMSGMTNVPCAHAPMLESWEAIEFETEHLDPRMAAEAISCSFLHSVLKGLATAPKITTTLHTHKIIDRKETVLVVPRNCDGPAVRAAAKHGLTVIEVMSNRNLCTNDMGMVPWKHKGQHLRANDYFDAAGILLALREGMDPWACHRPLLPIPAENR
jgi:hypothetical protein